MSFNAISNPSFPTSPAGTPSFFLAGTGSTLSQVGSAGFLSASYIQGVGIGNGDFIFVKASDGGGLYNVSIIAGVVTLAAPSGDVPAWVTNTVPGQFDTPVAYSQALVANGNFININGGIVSMNIPNLITSYDNMVFGTPVNNGVVTLDAGGNVYGVSASAIFSAGTINAANICNVTLGVPTASKVLTLNASSQITGNITVAGAGNGLTAQQGNLVSGSNGHNGNFILYPPTMNMGTVIVTANDNAGNFNVTINNASFGQSSQVTIPDPGVASTSFVLTDAAGGARTINGEIDLTGALHAFGHVSSGFSGTPGQMGINSSPTGVNQLVLNSTDNAGNFNTTIDTSATLGQETRVSIPDPGQATANFVLDTGTTTMASGSSIVMSKTNGTEAANAVTANGNCGVITTSSLTTGSGSSYVIAWTNSFVTASSAISMTCMGGTNSNANFTYKVEAGSGTATITIDNVDPVNPLNGTLLFGYVVF